ncbi:hypothetical protein [Micromonospora sp. NPDC047730]|uniref:hypothetical protein n=1 Tax=Micromonospora sp. NPDC047730 TaxID=3364253 RepID=UPI00371C2429
MTERTIPIHAGRAREALDAATVVPLTPAERVRDDLRRAEDLTADPHPEGRP